MSKFKKGLLLSILLVLVTTNAHSQPQWKFWIAFEEGTGQKDTLWMIWDTTATTGVDTLLDEGGIQFDYSKFNVWVYNGNFDSTKTRAEPYSSFANHALVNIGAFNFNYPIIIRWDTALFNSTVLPIQANNYINVARIDNDYFFGVNNDINLHALNMLYDDSAFAPSFNWGSQSQFPMDFNIGYNPNLYIAQGILEKKVVYPNPFIDRIFLCDVEHPDKIKLLNSFGQEIKINFITADKHTITIDTSNLKNGFFILVLGNKRYQLVKI